MIKRVQNSGRISGRGQRMVLRPRQRMSQRKVFMASTAFVIMATIGISFYFQFSNVEKAHAATSGDYRSIATGNWSATTTWQTYNGSSWVAASSTPAAGGGVIEIQSPDTVTVTANVTIDQTTVDAGGTLVVASGKTLQLNNGTGTDMTVNGIVSISGTLQVQGNATTILNGTIILTSVGKHTFAGGATITVNNGGLYHAQVKDFTPGGNTWTVNSGGTFQFDMDGQNLPQATWNSGSTCNITGTITSVPGNLNQTFYNLTWNSASQTGNINLQGKLDSIKGDFTIISTGTGIVDLANPENYTLVIGGNLNIQGGSTYCCTKSNQDTLKIAGNYVQSGGTFGGTDITSKAGDHATGTPVINVVGTFSVSAGTFDMTQNTGTASGNGITTLNLSGDFTQSGGTITTSAASTSATYGYGIINFTKPGTQNISQTGGSLTLPVNFTVNSGTTLDLGTSTLTGSGNFTLASGGTLNIGSANGITTSGASGNVQVTGTRSFNTGATYNYTGGAAQVTGNGLPATVANLNFNNALGVTLTNNVAVSSALTLTSGNVTTGTDTLTLGTATSTLGTLSYTAGNNIVGNFRRWIAASATSNILFPVGNATNYQGVNLSYTTAPTTGGTVTVTPTSANPGTNGFPLTDGATSIIDVGVYYWTLAPANGLAGGTFSLDVTATNLPGVSDYTKLNLITRANSASAWTVSGTSAAGTGSNTAPVVHRSGMTSLGQFGIGSGSSNALPVELLYFNAKYNTDHVDLTWATASEINNDYFTIERSQDGQNFEEVFRKTGAGTSTRELQYSGTDDGPLSGISYYRLSQTDYNGKFVRFQVKAVESASAGKNEPNIAVKTVGPNPFNDNFNINYSLTTDGEMNVQIMNTSGQMVYKETVIAYKGFNTYSFKDNRGLPKGIYIVTMESGGEAVTSKLIKQ